MPFAENTLYFRTALYSRQCHPRTLENRLISGFRLQRVFLPHLSAEKQKYGLSPLIILNTDFLTVLFVDRSFGKWLKCGREEPTV
jgi:hypothetical protein